MTELNSESISSAPILPAPARKRRWRAVALGLVILICGAVLGSGITVAVIQKGMFRSIREPDEVARRISERMRWRLKLSEEQHAQVRAILTERHRALQRLFKEAWPAVEKELNRTEEEVAAVLDPNQAASWRKRFKDLREKWIPSPPSDMPSK